jgi:hypothetical protein
MRMMKSPFKDRKEHRVRVRIPWLLELEGEGLVAVIGTIALSFLVILLVYVTR